MSFNITKQNIIKWATDLNIDVSEITEPNTNFSLKLIEKDMPPVVILNPTNFSNMIIVAGPVQLSPEHIGVFMAQSDNTIEDFIRDTGLILLEYGIEIGAKNHMGKLPTAWEFTYKIHIDELNAQKLWESYLKIKNSVLIFSTLVRSRINAPVIK